MREIAKSAAWVFLMCVVAPLATVALAALMINVFRWVIF